MGRDSGPGGSSRPPPRPTAALVSYIVSLAGGAALLALALSGDTEAPGGSPSWAALPALTVLIAVAEYLFVRFRYRGQITAFNLVEAVLTPVLFGFPGHIAVVAVAAGQAIGNGVRRNAPVKAIFNVSQWALATGAGAAVAAWLLDPGAAISLRTAGVLLIALVVVLLVNQAAFSVVLALVHGESPRGVIRNLAPMMLPGWLLGWVVNALFGLLFLFAYAAHPATIALFPAPLIVLHLAYRGYAGARSDRVRLAGLHSAARILAEPFDPSDAIEPFLREVARSFEARGAALVLRAADARWVHRVDAGGAFVSRQEGHERPSFEATLLTHTEPARISASGKDPLSRSLAAAGWRDCLSAPLVEGDRVLGALVVFDQVGLEGFEAGELAAIEALARETAGAFAKGRLLAAMLEERRRLSDLVSNSSDGIFALAYDGRVISWNPAMERITGIPAGEAVGSGSALVTLRPVDMSSTEVPFGQWTSGAPLQTEIRITRRDGSVRRLSCSYSNARDDRREARALVVVARDVTPAEEFEELRHEFGRLAEAEAAQRLVVEQLQQALMPPRPVVPGVELAVSYVSSDPMSPTGGDLYDWQVLPSGELHVTVVDVLGHGVEATRDALSVMHVLRLLAVEGCPLEQTVARADRLLGAQDPELAATVAIARYDPATGVLRLVSGGHLPALLVSPAGGVRQIPMPGAAIGWPGSGSESVAEIVLAPGERVVLYTDGIVEARKDIIEGEEMLMRHARELVPLPPDAFARELVQRALEGGQRRDDSLALVISRRGPVQGWSWTLAARSEQATEARRRFAAWLADQGVPVRISADLALVASELLSNAVAAARHSITIRAELEETSVTVEVEDDGHGHPELDRMGRETPPLFADAGRGLYIIRTIADDARIVSTSEGTVVRCSVRLRGQDLAATAVDEGIARRSSPTTTGITEEQ